MRRMLTDAGRAEADRQWRAKARREAAGDGVPAALLDALTAQLAAGAETATAMVPKEQAAGEWAEWIRVDRCPLYWAGA